MSFVLILLFLGKLIYFPIAFVVVSDDSMHPIYSRGDLVILVATYIVNYGSGDIVLWCIDDLRSGCCLHKISNISNRFIYTLGVSNHVLDTPVPKEQIYYKAFLSAPIYIWLPIIVILYIYGIYIIHRTQISDHGILRLFLRLNKSDPVYLKIYIKHLFLAILLVALINSLLVGSLYIDQSPPQYNIPLVSLVERVFDLGSSEIRLSMNISNYLVRDIRCVLDNESLSINYDQINNLLNITLHIPKNYYMRLWLSTSGRAPPLTSYPAGVYQSFNYTCTVYLDKGYLESIFVESFIWSEPRFQVVNKSILVIENSNPVDLNITIQIYDISRVRILTTQNISIEYMSKRIIDLSELISSKGSYEVRLYYNFLGSLRGVGVRIDL